MTRTPQEIFASHGEALMAEDLEALVADYSDDAVVVTPTGVRRGKDGARAACAELLRALPQAKWDVPEPVFEGDVLFFTWSAVAGPTQVTDGVDTLVFDDGGIRVHTVHYTLRGAA